MLKEDLDDAAPQLLQIRAVPAHATGCCQGKQAVGEGTNQEEQCMAHMAWGKAYTKQNDAMSWLLPLSSS